ncbi:MAG TPA: ATP-binding protein [Chitinophagaceae bacterium]|nr:ATP-binding protein [Chitinophagaceae bacterium]
MATSVKNKIRLGTLFLFLLLLLAGGVGIFNLVRLRDEAKKILRNNYESLDYCHAMQRQLDSFGVDTRGAVVRFGQALARQEANITEPGEREATTALHNAFNRFQAGDSSLANRRTMSAAIQQILLLNMAAIQKKNHQTETKANEALTFITIIAAVIFLVAFTFSFNFPAVIAHPIHDLTEGIREIGRKNYGHRIHLSRKDEFGQMADAFNAMAERLEYFENSNLNRLLFEKARAEAVIKSMRDASIGIDRNGIVLFANDQALQLLSLQTRDIVGKPATEIAARNDLFRYLLMEKNTGPFKIVVNNKENYFIRETIEVPQEDARSQVIVVKNITSFKELDVAKTNFIATISHELKTPLASSDFSLKLLEDPRSGPLNENQRELITHLRQDNQRMLRILSELLNMSQVESGKIQLDIREFAPGSIGDQALETVYAAGRDKDIRFEKHYAEPLPAVRADPEKAGWVLNNFLGNAIKYSPDGSVVILAIEPVEQGVCFRVTDRGPGIEKAYQPRIFDRFFKVPGTSMAGTGLGLSISREFIEAMGGRIWVDSNPGEGSSFSFTLPLA